MKHEERDRDLPFIATLFCLKESQALQEYRDLFFNFCQPNGYGFTDSPLARVVWHYRNDLNRRLARSPGVGRACQFRSSSVHSSVLPAVEMEEGTSVATSTKWPTLM